MKRIFSSLFHSLVMTLIWSAIAAPLVGALYYLILLPFGIQSLLWLAVPAVVVLFLYQYKSFIKDERNFENEKI